MTVSLLDGKLLDKATWWPVTGGDGFGGDAVGSPTLIDCRWEDMQVVFASQIDRREHVSNAQVFTKQDLSLGDYLCLGDQTAHSTPSSVPGAYKIQRYSKVSDLRNADSVRISIL